MRAMFILKLLLITTVFSFFPGCSDDDPQPGCYQEANRKIVATVSNVNGIIRQPTEGLCPDDFTIEPEEKDENRPLGLYVPCNLTEQYRVDGASVVFSGYVYESFETEDICADFFEITTIRLSNQ